MTSNPQQGRSVAPSCLPVWGGSVGSARRIVAAPTKKAAMAAARVSRTAFANYWCETGNADEIRIANAKPGVVFAGPYKAHSGGYVEEAAPIDRVRPLRRPIIRP